MAAGQPKPAFYVALAVVVLGLIAFAYYRSDIVAPKPVEPQGGGGGVPQAGKIEPKDLGGWSRPSSRPTRPGRRPSRSTSSSRPRSCRRSRGPPPTSRSRTTPSGSPSTSGPAGRRSSWPTTASRPGKVWKTPDGKEFKVELVLIDNPVAMRDAYAAGEVHIGWATLDMVPLFVESFVDTEGNPRDSRIMPRIYQQVDWSNGGDGIVVRENIKTVADLRGKKLVLAQNSPSHYFALNMLVSGGVQPSEVEMIFTEDAFQAAAAFNAQKDIAGCVSWAPDIYNLAKVKGNRMLVTTQTANKLIADVWFARADFAQDHPADHRGARARHLRRHGASSRSSPSGRRSPS